MLHTKLLRPTPYKGREQEGNELPVGKLSKKLRVPTTLSPLPHSSFPRPFSTVKSSVEGQRNKEVLNSLVRLLGSGGVILVSGEYRTDEV